MTDAYPRVRPSFRRIDVDELAQRMAEEPPPLVLDVRRGASFDGQPGIPTAVPFVLDREPILIPEVPRDRFIVAYCL